MSSNNGYLLNTASPEERERLAAVQAELDPGTIRHLERLGIPSGHRCLEVGGGAGSIAAWLSDRVGPTGSVTATDIEPVHLLALARERPNVEALRHDILTDPLPASSFDVVHVRWLLHHFAEPRRALGSMFGALRPGGWLLAEEVDLASIAADVRAAPERAVLLRKFADGLRALLAKRGGSYEYGRRLFSDVRACELVDVAAEGRASMGSTGTPLNTNLRFTVKLLRGAFGAQGLLTTEEADELLAMSNDPSFTWMGYTTMAVWGRRPPE